MFKINNQTQTKINSFFGVYQDQQLIVNFTIIITLHENSGRKEETTTVFADTTDDILYKIKEEFFLYNKL